MSFYNNLYLLLAYQSKSQPKVNDKEWGGGDDWKDEEHEDHKEDQGGHWNHDDHKVDHGDHWDDHKEDHMEDWDHHKEHWDSYSPKPLMCLQCGNEFNQYWTLA